MKQKDLQDSMAYIGQDLIDMAEKRTFRPSPWRGVLAAAAALAVMAGAGAGLWLHYVPAVPPQLTQAVEEAPEMGEEPEALPPEDEMLSTEEQPIVEKTPLQEMFPMLTEDSTHFAHPEADWAEDLQLNQAGLDQAGTDLWTEQGDQVLALDMVNELLLLRVKGEDYQGVLAICKDPARLSLQPSEGLGQYGQTVGEIAEAHGGILAINASGFLDSSGKSPYPGEPQFDAKPFPDSHSDAQPGGRLAGYAMYDGVAHVDDTYFDLFYGMPYGRIEISEEGSFHLTQPGSEFRDDTRYACAAYPPMIVGGDLQTEAMAGWSGQHPRTCIGQASDGSVLLLVIEGRQPERSIGLNIPGCAEILQRYDCQTAIALSYGTSSVMWYRGAPVTQCSNPLRPDGFPGPDAFVIRGQE